MTHVCSQLRSTFSQVTITLPASYANKVPFRPNPTFKPGWNLNVRCVTKMVPAWTKLPSWNFQPRCLGLPWFHRFLVLLPVFFDAHRINDNSVNPGSLNNCECNTHVFFSRQEAAIFIWMPEERWKIYKCLHILLLLLLLLLMHTLMLELIQWKYAEKKLCAVGVIHMAASREASIRPTLPRILATNHNSFIPLWNVNITEIQDFLIRVPKTIFKIFSDNILVCKKSHGW